MSWIKYIIKYVIKYLIKVRGAISLKTIFPYDRKLKIIPAKFDNKSNFQVSKFVISSAAKTNNPKQVFSEPLMMNLKNCFLFIFFRITFTLIPSKLYCRH